MMNDGIWKLHLKATVFLDDEPFILMQKNPIVHASAGKKIIGTIRIVDDQMVRWLSALHR